MKKHNVEKSKLDAHSARRLTVEMLHAGGEGHYGGSLSMIDILSVLFEGFINPEKDKFILSKGHGAPGYYASLAQKGLIPSEKLADYGRVGASLQGHPDMTTEEMVDFSTGSLGQGLSAGLGMALALSNSDSCVWVLLGDGECQEGQVWEAAMLADRLKLSNLKIVIDANGHQEWGFRTENGVEEPILNDVDKWSSFGWNVVDEHGHDHNALWQAFDRILEWKDGPSCLIARTKKGFGSKIFEQEPDRFHCSALSSEEFDAVMEELQ